MFKFFTRSNTFPCEPCHDLLHHELETEPLISINDEKHICSLTLGDKCMHHGITGKWYPNISNKYDETIKGNSGDIYHVKY